MEVAIVPHAPAQTKSVQGSAQATSPLGDRVFEGLTLVMAFAVVVLVFLVGWQLARGSISIKHFGFSFFITSTWDPVEEQFGAFPFIFGTVVSSLIALVIAVPLSIATAVYLTELAPLWMRQPLSPSSKCWPRSPASFWGSGEFSS